MSNLHANSLFEHARISKIMNIRLFELSFCMNCQRVLKMSVVFEYCFLSLCLEIGTKENIPISKKKRGKLVNWMQASDIFPRLQIALQKEQSELSSFCNFNLQ